MKCIGVIQHTSGLRRISRSLRVHGSLSSKRRILAANTDPTLQVKYHSIESFIYLFSLNYICAFLPDIIIGSQAYLNPLRQACKFAVCSNAQRGLSRRCFAAQMSTWASGVQDYEGLLSELKSLMHKALGEPVGEYKLYKVHVCYHFMSHLHCRAAFAG